MNNLQKIILFSLASISALSWIISKDQPDMMKAMMTYDPIAIALFTASWTIGMVAMMFPAIIPMILLYNRLISVNNSNNDVGYGTDSVVGHSKPRIGNPEYPKNKQFSLIYLFSLQTAKTYAFIGTYLLVWTLTGILLLLLWSSLMSNFFVSYGPRDIDIVSGILLVISGIYQFSSLKKRCLGYCESPLAFFMKRWKGNNLASGLNMGLYHGMYCLGCCWPYFLLMIALGWMNIVWMGLFAAIIFAEKVWSRGIYVARAIGLAFMLIGLLLTMGIVSITTESEESPRSHQMNDMVMEKSTSSANGIHAHTEMNRI